jgi:transcriptional antiterminator RfaH
MTTSPPAFSLSSSSSDESEELPDAEYIWRCVHTKPKCEHIAARNVKMIGHEGIDVFCPRVRFCKNTKRGKVWFVESMFPGYIFVKFDLFRSLRAVNGAHGVTRVIRFANVFSEVNESIISDLRTNFDQETEQITVHQTLIEGDEVEVAEGALRGASAVVTKILPGKDRVRILLEFLGSRREIEVPLMSVLGNRNARGEALPASKS